MQRLFHRPEQVARSRRGNADEPLGRQAELIEAEAAGRAVFDERHVPGDPDDVVFLAAIAMRESQRKSGRCRDMGLARRRDLMQRTASEAAAKHGIDGRNAEGEECRRRFHAERALQGGDGFA